MDIPTTLVIDNGGCNCRIGWADDDNPSVIAPNATAHQRGHLGVFVADQLAKVKNQVKLSNHQLHNTRFPLSSPTKIMIFFKHHDELGFFFMFRYS